MNGDSAQILTRRFQQIQGADCIGIEVIKRDIRCQVMGRLCSGMDNARWSKFLYQVNDTLTVADVQFVVPKVRQHFHESLLTPSCITLRAEKYGPLIVVNTMNGESLFMEKCSNF